MRLSCPACQASFSLDVALAREADAEAVAALLDGQLVPELRGLLVRYLALFRPGKNQLGIQRAVRLAGELLPDIRRGAITRKGREWAAPMAVWRAALEHVLAMRDKGSITLPLAGHGYLHEVISGLADKAEALQERELEAAARQRAPLPMHPQHPQHAHQVAQALVATPPPPPPYDLTKGPSRTALELKARISAARAAKTAAPAADIPDDTTGGAT